MEIWPDTHVGEGSLNVQITTIRKALGQDYILAEPKLGYRFTAKVNERWEDITEEARSVRRSSKLWLIAPLLVIAAVAILYLVVRFKTRPGLQGGGPAVALYQRALDYERIGDDEQALTTLDQAIAQDSAYQPACVRAAYIAYELDDEQKATKYLERCRAVESRDEELRLKAQALTQVLKGDPSRAIQVYKLLTDKYPGDADGLYRFAELTADLDRLEEAETAVRACLSIAPEDPYCRFQSMYVKVKQNKFDDVLAEYKVLPARIREYPWFDELVGVAQLGDDRLDEAVQTFEHLSARQGKLHGTQHFIAGKEWIADVWLYEGRVQDATDRIKQLMETTDNESDLGGYNSYVAQIYAVLGDSAKAEHYANEAIHHDPENLTQPALVLASVGNASRTEQVLKQDASMTQNNKHLIRGVLAASTGDTTRGIEEIKLAYDFNPRDEEAAYQLGMAYLHAGDYKTALQMFQAVENLKGAVLMDNVPLLWPLSLYRIGECYDRLGDASTAKPYYAAVAKIWAHADGEVRQKYPAIDEALK